MACGDKTRLTDWTARFPWSISVYGALIVFWVLRALLAPLAIPNWVPVQAGSMGALVITAVGLVLQFRGSVNRPLRGWTSIVVPLFLGYLVVEAALFLPLVHQPNSALLTVFISGSVAAVVLLGWSVFVGRSTSAIALPTTLLYQHLLFSRLLNVGPIAALLTVQFTAALFVLCVLVQAVLRREQRLQQALAQLERTTLDLAEQKKQASLSLIAAGLAHEINNPINYLAGDIRFLRENLLALTTVLQSARLSAADRRRADAAQREIDAIMQSYQKGIAQVTRAMNSLKGLQRSPGITRDPVDVPSLVRETSERCVQRFIQRSSDRSPAPAVQLEVVCPDDTVTWHGSAGDLETVVSNLVQNAVEAAAAMEDNGARVVIRVAQQVTERGGPRRLVLEVEDNGPGIADDERERVFEPFYTTRQSADGMGIGLYLVRRLVTAHRGTVGIERVADRWTRFRVELPLAAAAAAGLNGDASAAANANGGRSGGNGGPEHDGR